MCLFCTQSVASGAVSCSCGGRTDYYSGSMESSGQRKLNSVFFRIKATVFSQVTPSSINITNEDTIWPVSCVGSVCVWVGVGERVWATSWLQPKSILSTGTPGFDMEQLLPQKETDLFVMSVHWFYLSSHPQDVIWGSKNWSAPKLKDLSPLEFKF